MQDQYEDITGILAKYPEISSIEDGILKEWIGRSEVNQKIFEDLISPEELLSMLKSVEQCKTEKKRIWQRVLSDINARPESEKNKAKIVWFLKWQTYTAAASVIIIASVFIYMWQFRKPAKTPLPTSTVAKVNDASPGKYKAKLTLDDGSVVVLDSFSNKQLVQQGSTIVYYKDGKLVYEQGGKETKVLYNTLTTAKGETYATVLSDGSKVWLNSQSSIHYPVAFDDDSRRVEIRGEAYFEVAPSIGKNGKRPFIVSANGMEIEVLGTHFNINSYTDEPAMKTTLLEGKVKVRSTSSNAQTILAPGEQAILRQAQDDKITLSKAKDVDVDAEVAWRYGMFQFNNADLKTVMRQLERWYDVQVVYQGNVGDFEFLGKIPRNMNLSQVLTILQKVNVHFKIDGKKIIVTP